MIPRTRARRGLLWRFGLATVGCSFIVSGCGSDAGIHSGDDASADGGGQPKGTGGAVGTGGGKGTGGALGTGGVSGTGGIAASGGTMGSGGTQGSGGTPGAGGTPGGPDGGVDAGDASTADGGLPMTSVIAAGVRWIGRVDLTNPLRPRFSWSGTGFVARFSGTSLALQINNSASFLFKTVVDGVPQPTLSAAAGQSTVNLAPGLIAGVHTVELYRQTEGSQGDSQFLALTVGGGALMDPPAAPARLIEVVGDSISCGYGTLGMVTDLGSTCFATESHWDSYEAIAARALSAEVSTVAVSGQGMVRNFGGDMVNTLPMVYARALTNDITPLWDFRVQPQVVVINLGTNDISNNKGDPGVTFRDTYVTFVQTIRARYPNALIVCMIGPLLSGTDLTTIRNYIRAVVAIRNTAGDANIEFFDGITAQTLDKAACAFHPNPSENQIMAGLLVAELRTRLGW